MSSVGDWLVSIDAGGTFTDAVAHGRDGEILVAKVPSSPADPSQALTSVLTELSHLGLPIDQVALLCHGTTVATNAMLTGEWAEATLVCTAGFRESWPTGTGFRPYVYSLTPKRPVELIPRSRRLGATERIAASGEVTNPARRGRDRSRGQGGGGDPAGFGSDQPAFLLHQRSA